MRPKEAFEWYTTEFNHIYQDFMGRFKDKDNVSIRTWGGKSVLTCDHSEYKYIQNNLEIYREELDHLTTNEISVKQLMDWINKVTGFLTGMRSAYQPISDDFALRYFSSLSDYVSEMEAEEIMTKYSEKFKRQIAEIKTDIDNAVKKRDRLGNEIADLNAELLSLKNRAEEARKKTDEELRELRKRTQRERSELDRVVIRRKIAGFIDKIASKF